jgi:phosphate-selective porin
MKLLITLTSLNISFVQLSFAQDSSSVADLVEEVAVQVNGINETVLEVKGTVDALKKIKFSGYIQAQYQSAESDGISTYAGGSFPTNVRNRFAVRRGRLKMTYDNSSSKYVLQIDVTQNGVGIKDAYATFQEPWTNWVILTAGIFNRPFGFEIGYSSNNRETPERARMMQVLFPGERDLGAQIEIIPKESSPLSILNLKAGIFNGALSTSNENNNFKDFISRFGFELPFDNLNLAIDGGFSIYSGNVVSNSKKIYSIKNNKYDIDSTATNIGAKFGRYYYGGDLQVYYDLPILGGMSLRGEYIFGKQPGTNSSNIFYNPSSPNTDLYLRNFSGFYLNYVQNIGLDHQFVMKYDELDPNTDVTGDMIGDAGSNITTADIKYSSFGLGWIYHLDSNIKFVLYYDIVKNELVNSNAAGVLTSFKNDLKDDVLTFRIQYKF